MAPSFRCHNRGCGEVFGSRGRLSIHREKCAQDWTPPLQLCPLCKISCGGIKELGKNLEMQQGIKEKIADVVGRPGRGQCPFCPTGRECAACQRGGFKADELGRHLILVHQGRNLTVGEMVGEDKLAKRHRFLERHQEDWDTIPQVATDYTTTDEEEDLRDDDPPN